MAFDDLLPQPMRSTVLVCVTCRDSRDTPAAPPAGLALAEAAARAAEGQVEIRRVACLGNCRRGLSAALSRPGAWSYVFGGLDAATDGPALVEGACLLGASSDGLLPWRGRPDPLKRGLIARLPPLDPTGETP